MLHGLSDDHTIWCRRTSIERYVRDLPVVAVMPDEGRGFYTDAIEGMAYERHILEDVIGFVERNLNVRTDREGRAIGGLSMGGLGIAHEYAEYPGEHERGYWNEHIQEAISFHWRTLGKENFH
jgi:S-formylglutathione hydrolase FrmB